MLREGNTPLSSLADIHYGKSPNAVRNPRGHVPVIGTGGVTGRATASLFDGPAIVVGRKGTLDKPVYINEPFWPIDTTYAVIAKKDVDTKWLYYSLCTTDLKKLNEATGVPSINRDFLSRVEFFTPKEPEQRAIARVLDTVDEAMEATSAMLAKQEKIKQGLLQDLLTRGVDEKGRLRPTQAEAPNLYHHTPLGWLPKGWDVETIASISSNKGEYGAGASAKQYDNRLPRYVRITDIQENGRLDPDSRASISHLDAAPYMLKEGDLLFARSGATVGKTYLYKETDGSCAHAGYVIKFCLNPNKCVYDFVFRWTQSNYYWQQISQTIRQGAQPNINASEYAKFKIALPKPDEQETLSTIFNVTFDNIYCLSNELTKLRALKAGLMQDLLTGKKRVTPALMQQIQQQAA